MNENKRTRTSKFLSLVLRHEPARIGLVLDDAGWVEVDALLAALNQHRHALSRAELEEVVATNEKKRFAFSDNGRHIRASQGHSVEVALGYTAQVPPEKLYHGTATRFVESISKSGLRKGERHHVHLSADIGTAQKVGMRQGKPALLVIRAGAMHMAGHAFFLSENGVWLADHVPVEFIEFPDNAGAASNAPTPGKRSTRSQMALETVSICEKGSYQATNGSLVEIGDAIQRAVAGTRLHEIETVPQAVRDSATQTVIEVTSETTIAALQRLHSREGGHLACLNFASAKNPGGGFLGGSEAQEESLARSSALYPCLLAAPEYYERNRAGANALYLDLAIWSPAVPFIRDNSGALLAAPFNASVITAPAPNAGAIAINTPHLAGKVEPALRRRTAFVLAIAAQQSVRRLVLGAWGCGVFQNDPQLVAQVFLDLLLSSGPFSNAFDEVVFAIYDRSSSQEVMKAFQSAFA